MNKKCPLVCIGMPVWNCHKSLESSLRSLLMQTYTDWELMLIDDGSTDGTQEIAKRFPDPRIKIFSDGENQGLPARLNQAIQMAKSKYFARMDGDDIAYPERLECQVSYLEQHRDVDLVGSSVSVFGTNGTPLGCRIVPVTHTSICARPFAGFPIIHPTYFGRLEWFQHFRYRVEAIRCEDQDLLLRSYRTSKFANIPEILLGYREEKIYLKKILTSRRFGAWSRFQELRRYGRLDWAIRAIVGQIFKGVADTIAVGTGLNYHILRHRCMPLAEEERQRWNNVWALVTSEMLT